MTVKNRKPLTNYVPAQGKPESFVRYFQENPQAGVNLFKALTLVVNEIDNGTLTPASPHAAAAAALARDIWAGLCSPASAPEERRAA